MRSFGNSLRSSKNMEVLSSKIEKDVRRSLKAEKPVIFLGGSCDDENKWRKEVKDRYGKKFFFIDPYDKDWDPSDNTYDELAGIVNSDWILFYDGGKQSKREEDFLEMIGDDLSNVRKFSDLSDLKNFLEALCVVKPVVPLSRLMRKSISDLFRKKTAKKGVSYSFGCLTVPVPDQLAQEIISWGKRRIPDSILYTGDESMGRENEIHTTLFYGLVKDDPDEVREMMKGIKPFEARLGLINAFMDAGTHDVVKIEVECPELEKLHYLIEDELENKNKFPTYQAHVTVAYVKNGEGKKYVGDDSFRGRKFKVKDVVFSQKDHTEHAIRLMA